MNESFITVQGYLGGNPVLRKAGEHWVANFRLGVTPRRLERSTGQWHDGETQWYSVSAWRALGQNVATSLHKGDPVVVSGRLTARTWVNSSHQEVVSYEIEATAVGHDLHRGITQFQRVLREDAPGAEAQAAAPVDDTVPPSDGASAADWNINLGERDLAGAA